MRILGIHLTTLWIIQLLISLFLAVLFIQSGVDKIIDKKGNLDWLIGHFANSPLARGVRPMFAVITVLELTAGFLSGAGAVNIFLNQDSLLAFSGAVIAAIAITALFFGQRVAKDYAGAATLVPYFMLTLAAILLLTPSPYRF